MAKCSLVYSPACRAYNFGPEHPFTPIRGKMLTELLEQLGAFEGVIESQCATRAEIRRVHSERYVSMVERASNDPARTPAVQFGLGTTDVPVFANMHEATLWVVGGTLTAARQVIEGHSQRALHLAGGLHHAHHDRASGFCIYNDPAIAIIELLQSGFDRVVYLDIDAHHGDGVQALFYEDPRVLTISLHESGQYLFPGTGFPNETGAGPGAGYAANFPLAPNTEHTSYLKLFDQFIPPLLADFEPDIMVVECGVDAHAMDPLAHLNLSSHTYQALYHRIIDLADTFCDGQAVLHLGGGYNLDASTRLWAILALMLLGHDLPEYLPKPWLDAWQLRFTGALTPTLHDALADHRLDASTHKTNVREAQRTFEHIEKARQ